MDARAYFDLVDAISAATSGAVLDTVRARVPDALERVRGLLQTASNDSSDITRCSSRAD